MFNHIKRNHKRCYEKIKKLGREEAMSQNGRGYADDGKSPNDGWFKAQPSFRIAWMKNALRRMIEENKI